MSPKWLFSVAILVCLHGCGGPATRTALDSPDANSTDEPDTNSTDSGGAKTTGDGGACTPLSDVDSGRVVSFVVRNDATSDRFIATGADQDSPYWIDVTGPQAPRSLLLYVPFECGCECQFGGYPTVTEVHRIAPGEVFTVSWDAREWTSDGCDGLLDCGHFQFLDVKYVLRPVAAGHYRVTLRLFDTEPVGWNETNADYSCLGPCAPPTPEIPLAADFTLPSSGDTTVELSLK